MSDTNSQEVQDAGKPEKEFDITIIQSTLSPDMLEEAITKAKESFQTSRVEKDVATAIKKYFDGKIFGSSCMYN